MDCLCGSGQPYSDCCQPFHLHQRYPETAEQLMRSRYVAYALQLKDYLLETWSVSTRPEKIDFEADLKWLKLRVIKTKKGGEKDSQGMVAFKATFEANGEKGVMSEKSQFKRNADHRWVYVTGEVS